MDPATCPICNSPWRTRIEGWILSGENLRNVEVWCRELDPPLELSRYSMDDHLDGGHIDIGKQQVVSMLVKYNREAEDVIQTSLGMPSGMPRNALNVAMQIRMRTIELIAKAHNVIEQGPRTTNQELNVLLGPDVQKRMLGEALKALEPPPAKLEADEPERITGEPPKE